MAGPKAEKGAGDAKVIERDPKAEKKADKAPAAKKQGRPAKVAKPVEELPADAFEAGDDNAKA